MRKVNLQGLTDEQLDLLERIAEFMRRAPESEDQAREELRELWREWSAKSPRMPEADLERLAEEAVAHARRGV